MNIEKLTKTAMFVALGVGLGYILSYIPNIELITSTIFISGFLLGSFHGGIVGILVFLIYGFFNPYGSSPLPLLIAQITGGMVAGITGGKIKQKALYFTVAGFCLSLFYDIITNISGYILFPARKTFIAYLLTGLTFSITHILSNTIIFGAVLYPLGKKLKK